MPQIADRPAFESPVGQRDLVVLVHGLGGHRALMLPLARSLRGAGFATRTWGYRSLWGDLPAHAEALRRKIDGIIAQQPDVRLHLVTHSMGGVLLRLALDDFQPAQLGRVVMLCPPNYGSHAATRLSRWLGWLCRPMTQIADSSDSFIHTVPADLARRYPVGVVVAARDFVVHPHSTRLPGVAGEVTLPGMHSAILFSRRAAQETAYFLSHGEFMSRPSDL